MVIVNGILTKLCKMVSLHVMYYALELIILLSRLEYSYMRVLVVDLYP